MQFAAGRVALLTALLFRTLRQPPPLFPLSYGPSAQPRLCRASCHSPQYRHSQPGPALASDKAGELARCGAHCVGGWAALSGAFGSEPSESSGTALG